jgi:predicted secreted protein
MTYRIAALAALLLTIASAAQAGDAAARKVLGFSPDGERFAFEQFTQFYDASEVLDEIQIVDTRTDRLVKDTPIRIETKSDDERDVETVRAALLVKAAPLLARHKISQPGTRFAGKPSIGLDDVEIYQAATEPLAKAQDIALPDGRKLSLMLTDNPLGSATCKSARGVESKVAVAGLSLQASINHAAPQTLALDRKLPKARRCVTGYGIAEVWHHQAADGAQSLAVLIETVDHNDFHAGPNRRFMVVTHRLPPA